MATTHMTEKLEQEQQLEHIETNHSLSPSELELQKAQTLRYVDVENKHAFKGDNSDGKIEWTVRKLFASAFLAMLYTGMGSSYSHRST
jgi:hypothetical protein